MNITISRLCGATALAALAVPFPSFAGAPSDLAQLDFFEKKIRPVLVENCYECHSAQSKKLKAGLLLDTREGLLTGGDTGPGIVPGDIKKSLLLIVMRHEDRDPDMAMPPKKDKLPDAVIADFEQWVKMGAPDPRSGKSVAKGAVWDAAKAADHWAFKKVTTPPVPNPADPKHFVQNPIDSFVLAKLAAKKLQPSPKAGKLTLIKRVTYDLTGLPPSPAEVDAFLADNSPDAYGKLVDRLLASPHYGERWARHWLDIARYSDTSGDRQNGGRRQPLYPHAWTYRDYVVGAFNKDLPYDRFLTEQIAADRLPESQQDKTRLAALGFLTVGKRFMGNENDMLDDRIDVVTKGLMGITGACARCHDHKFDPIPTKDYYSLHGIFSSSEEPSEAPALCDPEKNPAYKDFQAEVAKVEREVVEYGRTEAARMLSGMLEKAGDYLLIAHEGQRTSDSRQRGENFRLAARDKGLKPELATIWLERMKDLGSAGKKDAVFGPWFQFADLSADKITANAADLVKEIAASTAVNPAIAQAFAVKSPASLKDVAGIYTEVFASLHDQMKLGEYVGPRGGRSSRYDIAKTEKALPDPAMESLRKQIFSTDSHILPDERTMSRALGNQFTNPQGAIRAKIPALELTHPGAPVKAMTLVDRSRPRDSAVLVRGEPNNRGPVAPRQFLTVLSSGSPKPFTDGSGRLELARAIASRDNPLTARVIANRVWQWHFGQAIVRTVSDFGTRSEPPTHPELLDWLATSFMENGWSLKKLHKLIVTSATYQQDSRGNEHAMKADPTNQWLWRFNIQRLDFEQVRDTLLTISGKLDLAMGGQPFSLTDVNAALGRSRYGMPDLAPSKTSPYRRTIYAMIDRSSLPEMFNTFDFANPDMSTGERILTTVPQQALFMMNSPFVAEQVRGLLARADFPAAGSVEEKVRFIFRTVFQRAPRPAEIELAKRFIGDEASGALVASLETGKADNSDDARAARKAFSRQITKPLNAWERYTQVVLLTNELIFVN